MAQKSNWAINERMEQEEILRTQIEEKLENEKGNAVEGIFDDKENRHTQNQNQPNKSEWKENPLTNSHEEARKLAQIQIRQMPAQNSKVELKFSEKVFPHLAMREKFLKKFPDPKPKNANSGKRDEHNFLFYKDKGDEFLKRGDLDAAVEAFSVSLELNSECVKALVNRGLARLRKFEYEDSRRDIDSALELLKSRGEGREFRGRNLTKMRSSKCE